MYYCKYVTIALATCSGLRKSRRMSAFFTYKWHKINDNHLNFLGGIIMNELTTNTKVGSLGHKIAGVLIIIFGSILGLFFLFGAFTNHNWAVYYFALLFAGLVYYGTRVMKRPKHYEYSVPKFFKGLVMVIVTISLGFIINSQWKSYKLAEDEKWNENLIKKYVKETAVPSMDCLTWDLKTHESDIVQSNWAKTVLPGGITSYVDYYSSEKMDIQRQFTFVNGKLGQVSITLLDFTQTPEAMWATLLLPIRRRFGDPDIWQGPAKYMWTLPEHNINIWSGYKDGYGAWITVGTRNWDIYRQVLGAISDGLQLIY